MVWPGVAQSRRASADRRALPAAGASSPPALSLPCHLLPLSILPPRPCYLLLATDRSPRQVLFGTDNFGSRARGERVYRDAVRASCLHLELERFSCPEFGNGGPAAASAAAAASASAAAAASASAASAASASASNARGAARVAAAAARAAAKSSAKGSLVEAAVDHQLRLNGLGLKASPELLRSVLFENAARLLGGK